HPGGAIGKRIFLKVSDLMIKGKDLPYVNLNAPFQEVISTITAFSKGAALVLSDKKFCGLIAERDLRKAMEKLGSQVFDTHAFQIMNENPTTITADLLAIEAFNKMHSHNPPFNLLPVLDGQGRGIGMIRMLDLIDAGFSV
ncbi:MAG: CBS domain-containing protein, partial [Silvanigrellaceae bacterium]|nr:CBS domain-containing protein [Silvanigrellaceae bacterium]